MQTTHKAVLFDLDGTLADTAPDLAAALNRMLERKGRAPFSVEQLRPFASAGPRGYVEAAFGVSPGHAEYGALHRAFLDCYSEQICVHTRLYPGTSELLVELRKRQVRWGIVTNKITRLTLPLIASLRIDPACLVCGDTASHAKPHPAPVICAARQLRSTPPHCLFIGDDLRDIQAARATGAKPIAIQWGYHQSDSGPSTWQSDAVLAHPLELLNLLPSERELICGPIWVARLPNGDGSDGSNRSTAFPSSSLGGGITGGTYLRLRSMRRPSPSENVQSGTRIDSRRRHRTIDKFDCCRPIDPLS